MSVKLAICNCHWKILEGCPNNQQYTCRGKEGDSIHFGVLSINIVQPTKDEQDVVLEMRGNKGIVKTLRTYDGTSVFLNDLECAIRRRKNNLVTPEDDDAYWIKLCSKSLG